MNTIEKKLDPKKIEKLNRLLSNFLNKHRDKFVSNINLRGYICIESYVELLTNELANEQLLGQFDLMMKLTSKPVINNRGINISLFLANEIASSLNYKHGEEDNFYDELSLLLKTNKNETEIEVVPNDFITFETERPHRYYKAYNSKNLLNSNAINSSISENGPNSVSIYLYLKRKVDLQFISSISDFISTITECIKRINIDNNSSNIDEDETDLSIPQKQVFYRGHSDVRYDLIPSVFRSYSSKVNEDILYQSLMIKTPNHFNKSNLFIDDLREMQHYGLPTRVLDITTNPLIALFFAVSGNLESDAEVVLLVEESNKVKNNDSDSVHVLSTLATLTDTLKKDIFAICADENIVNYDDLEPIKKLVHQATKRMYSFQNNIDKSTLNEIYFIKPYQNNSRIIRQAGAFIVGDNSLANQEETEYTYAEMSKKFENKRLVIDNKKLIIIIPKNVKTEIIGALNLIDINTSTVYPEIEKVSEYLVENLIR